MTLATSDKKMTSHFNWVMLFIVLCLISSGLATLYSSLNFWGVDQGISLFWSQIVWFSAGLIIMFFLSFFDYRLLEKAGFVLYGVSIVLLLMVLFFGKTVAGHKSWLSLGPVAVQPCEFAKLALIILLSRYFSRNPHPDGARLIELWQPILYSMIPAALVILQGDLGSAIFFVLIFLTYAWFGHLRWRGIAILATVGIIGAVVVFNWGLSDYQRARFSAFMEPGADARGSGYHLVQSRIAVGSGGVLGKGYLKGNINKLKYLPEKHTDFIFPVLAEEWGFVGGAFVLLLYFLFLASGVEIVKKARDRAGLFLAIGIIAFIFWHMVINLGGVLGLMPLTGVTLPFMSYGGSSTIILMSSVGILFSIGMRRFLF